MLETLMDIISEVKESPELRPALSPESEIVNEVGLDSLQMINFVLAVEDAFDVQIDFAEFNYDHLRSIRSFCQFIEKMKRAKEN